MMFTLGNAALYIQGSNLLQCVMVQAVPCLCCSVCLALSRQIARKKNISSEMQLDVSVFPTFADPSLSLTRARATHHIPSHIKLSKLKWDKEHRQFRTDESWFLNRKFLQMCYAERFDILALADLGGAPGTRAPPLGPKISLFSCSFREKLAK